MKNSDIRILIVEDSAIQAETLRRMLIAEGYSVFVAKDGAEGLLKAKESRPELVISDIVMPEMNGFELCKHIKSDAEISSTPVILLTSLSDPTDVISGLECGADNFIVKPYEKHHLISRIKQIILNREFQENSRTQMGVELYFAGKKYFITSEKKQILDLLISTYESAVQKNTELIKAEEELNTLNENLEHTVQKRTSALVEEIEMRKNAEMDLVSSEIKYRRLFEAAKDGILIINAETGEIRDVNPFLIELLGFSKAEVIGKSFWDIDLFRDIVANKANFLELLHKGFARYEDVTLETCDGRKIEVEFVSNAYEVKDYKVIQCNIRDITERKKLEKLQHLAHETLALMNGSKLDEGTMRDILAEIKKATGFEAVALRLRDGDDFPYYVTDGFSEDFVRTERFLCARDSSGKIEYGSNGNPVLECMCGNIICGRTDPEQPFFTKGGSFWTNSTTKLLASTTEADRLAHTHNRCNREGYESVALIPLVVDGKSIGLLQLNDHRPNQFNPETISFFERLGGSIGIALVNKWTQAALKEEQAFTENALNSLKDLFFVFDLEERLLRWNKTMNNVLGYSDSEIASMKPTDFFEKEAAERISKTILAVVKEGSADIEELIVTKDGRQIPYEFTAALLRDYKGIPIGISGVGRDVTERKAAEVALKESEIRHRTLLEHLTQKIFLKDRNSVYVTCNKSYATDLKITPEEIRDRTDYDFYPKELAEKYRADDRVVMESGVLKDIEERYILNGEERLVQTIKTPVRDAHGNVVSVLGISWDITDRKKMEQQLREYARNLEAMVAERTRELEDANTELQILNNELTLRRQEADSATQAKSDFLANMSHELRTPLNSIIGFSQVLKKRKFGQLTEKQDEYVGYVIDSGEHLLALINDILDLSKVEAGKVELEVGSFNLQETLNASLSMFREKTMKHGIALKLDIAPDADIAIEADERRLKQILFNLISNAVKFTPDGGAVYLRAQKRDEDSIELSVEDTGIGIKEEDMLKLFKEFSQIESSYDKKYEGTGLGLALTKKLVEKHGGRIWCESKFGKGSRFAFVIPVRQGGRHNAQDTCS